MSYRTRIPVFVQKMAEAYLDCIDFTDGPDWCDEPSFDIGFSDELVDKAYLDCMLFLDLLEREGFDYSAFSPTELGKDFWLTRNRHGAGFWDGDWPEPDASLLTDVSHTFGELSTFVDEEGMIRFS